MFRSIFRFSSFALLLSLTAAWSTAPALAQKKSAPAQDDPQMLSLEVVALQTLHRLDLTAPQLENLLRLSKGAASAPRTSGAGTVTPAFLKTLLALRNALLAGDDELIDELKSKLGAIMDSDKIHLDDRVLISDPARRYASQAIRMLQPSQVLAYLQVIDEDDVDLFDILEAAIEKGKDASPARWRTLRDDIAAETAWLVVGGDETKTRVAVKVIAAVLDQHHNPKGKNAAPDLEKQVEQMTAGMDPFMILRNVMEREIAELMSNPQLPQAIRHTLEQKRKLAAK